MECLLQFLVLACISIINMSILPVKGTSMADMISEWKLVSKDSFNQSILGSIVVVLWCSRIYSMQLNQLHNRKLILLYHQFQNVLGDPGMFFLIVIVFTWRKYKDQDDMRCVFPILNCHHLFISEVDNAPITPCLGSLSGEVIVHMWCLTALTDKLTLYTVHK